MEKYIFLEHTADVMFEAFGKDLNELFENAALATSEVMVNTQKLQLKIKKAIKLKNEDIESLLFDFIGQIIYYKDAEVTLFAKFKVQITKNHEYKLEATATGERINYKKHELRNDVKAITMHKFKIEKTSKGYKATIILDI